MRAGTILFAAVASTVAGCAPSRAYLFDPVAASVQDRTGVTPKWRAGWRRSPAADRRVREILAAPLTADGAALVAILNSPELQAVYADLGVAGGSVARARATSNPELEGELTFPLDDGHAKIELGAVQDVTDLVLILPRVRAADAGLEAARRRAVSLTVDLAARARIAFYRAAAAEHRLALRRMIAEAAAASAAFARSLFDAGNLTELDLTRETVFEEEAALAVVAAEADAVAAREALNAVLGLHGEETGWTIARELPAPPERLALVDDLEREAVAASLDLEALRWELEEAGREIGVARLESFVPGVGLGVVAKRDDGWGVGPAVTLSLPLFDRGQGRRAAAWARLRRLQHQYTGAAIAIRAAARSARARVVADHARVTRIRTRLLPMRERLLDQAVRQYNAMNLDAFALLVIRREHIEAEEQYIEALRDYWIAQTEVDQLRAGSLPRGMAGGGDAGEGHTPRGASGAPARGH